MRWSNSAVFTVDKPAGMSVFPPHANPNGDCLLHRIVAAGLCNLDPWPDGFAGGIAHRLDIPTSGQIVVAQNRDGLQQIDICFRVNN